MKLSDFTEKLHLRDALRPGARSAAPEDGDTAPTPSDPRRAAPTPTVQGYRPAPRENAPLREPAPPEREKHSLRDAASAVNRWFRQEPAPQERPPASDDRNDADPWEPSAPAARKSAAPWEQAAQKPAAPPAQAARKSAAPWEPAAPEEATSWTPPAPAARRDAAPWESATRKPAAPWEPDTQEGAIPWTPSAPAAREDATPWESPASSVSTTPWESSAPSAPAAPWEPDAPAPEAAEPERWPRQEPPAPSGERPPRRRSALDDLRYVLWAAAIVLGLLGTAVAFVFAAMQ